MSSQISGDGKPMRTVRPPSADGATIEGDTDGGVASTMPGDASRANAHEADADEIDDGRATLVGDAS